jgi:ferrous iron transport protein B
MPSYKLPLFKNVALNVIEKTKAFVFWCKIILAISIVLWFMASYGPGEKFNNAETIQFSKRKTGIPQEELDNKAAYKLENSYIGIMGKVLNLLFLL